MTQETTDPEETIITEATLLPEHEVTDPEASLAGRVLAKEAIEDAGFSGSQPSTPTQVIVNPIDIHLDAIDQLPTELGRIKALGVRHVWQHLGYKPSQDESTWTNEVDWPKMVQYIEVLESLGMHAAFGYLLPHKLNGDGTWNLDIIRNQIVPFVGSPALWVFQIGDEPKRHGFTSAQVVNLYKAVKPLLKTKLLAVGFSGEIWKVYLEMQQNPGRVHPNEFTADMCDLALVASLDYRDLGAGCVFRREELIQRHEVSRRVIKAADPNTLIGTNLPAFGRQGTTYCFPTIEEMETLLGIVHNSALVGPTPLNFELWQQWEIKSGVSSLGSAAGAGLREIVKRQAGG